MFDSLSDRIRQSLDRVRGRGKITERNVEDTLRDIRMALLEADVALPVVKRFIAEVKERAVGQEVIKSLSPGQVLIKIVQDVLTELMGQVSTGLDLKAQSPVVILMAGLQGAGKTTTVAKLGRWLKTELGKDRVMAVSCDVYRPAAIKQLETVADQVGISFFPSQADQQPVRIARDALKAARQQMMDVLLVDTAGRLHIDDDMMQEIQQIHAAVKPTETLFVVDSMTGQDAVHSAKAFDDALALTGVVLTKTDGDSRGGCALSVREITGKPIKFMGVGEKLDALELFHPDRVASRILGMGDVLTLVEDAQRKVDKQVANKLARKLTKGRGFDLADFYSQLQQMKKMGGLTGLLDKLPGMSGMGAKVKDQVNDKELAKLEAMINSMTPQERAFPKVIKGSRKRRIAAGSGTVVPDVNRLLKQFAQMQRMMKKMPKGNPAKMMQAMKQRMPGGGFPGMGG